MPDHMDEVEVVVRSLRAARVESAVHEVGREQDDVIVYSSERLRPSTVPWRHVDHEESVPSPVGVQEEIG